MIPQTLSQKQAECIRDSLYLTYLLIYQRPTIENPFPKTISEETLMSTLRSITNGQDETSRDYYEEH